MSEIVIDGFTILRLGADSFRVSVPPNGFVYYANREQVSKEFGYEFIKAWLDKDKAKL